jgi:hypothetical protein
MILLDTNYLIRALVPQSEEMQRIVDWITAGEELITSAVSWYEFICGPVDEEGIAVVSSLIEDRIIPFTRDQAAEAAAGTPPPSGPPPPAGAAVSHQTGNASAEKYLPAAAGSPAGAPSAQPENRTPTPR